MRDILFTLYVAVDMTLASNVKLIEKRVYPTRQIEDEKLGSKTAKDKFKEKKPKEAIR